MYMRTRRSSLFGPINECDVGRELRYGSSLRANCGTYSVAHSRVISLGMRSTFDAGEEDDGGLAGGEQAVRVSYLEGM